jgi:hypothetical protein
MPLKPVVTVSIYSRILLAPVRGSGGGHHARMEPYPADAGDDPTRDRATRCRLPTLPRALLVLNGRSARGLAVCSAARAVALGIDRARWLFPRWRAPSPIHGCRIGARGSGPPCQARTTPLRRVLDAPHGGGGDDLDRPVYSCFPDCCGRIPGGCRRTMDADAAAHRVSVWRSQVAL